MNFQLVLLSIAAVLLTQAAAAPPAYGRSYGAVPGMRYSLAFCSVRQCDLKPKLDI